MHTDIKTVTTQSNKIVLNDVKDNQAQLSTIRKKNVTTFWPTQYHQECDHNEILVGTVCF